jgi:uncharacterized membrane protein YadS
MKYIIVVALLLGIAYGFCVTAEEQYGSGLAYHAHTSYGLKQVQG